MTFITTFALAVFGFSLSAIIAKLTIPYIIKASLESGMTTVDAHKKGMPKIAEPGGLGPLLAFSFSFLIVVVLIVVFNLFHINLVEGIDSQLPNYLGGILAVIIAGLIGLIDDVFGRSVKWRDKIILGFLPALPLVILQVGKPSIEIPLLGSLTLGIWYGLIIIPLGMNFAFNSFNMLAGYNGLEGGLGIISFLAILFVSIWVDDPLVLIFASCMLGGLIILFWYNKFPARVLIGNSGTLMLGASIFVALVLGNMERLAIGIFLLYLINFIMFFFYLRDENARLPNGDRIKLASIDEEENLKPPSPWTVYWIIPYFRPKTKEYTNVAIILFIQAVICFLTVIWFFLAVPSRLILP